jgi:glucokinase
MLYAGVDIGGTNIKYGLVNDRGEILSSRSVPTNASDGPAHLIEKIHSILTQLSQSEPASIGVGFPSVVNPQSGVVYHPPNLPGWGEFALLDELRNQCPIPVFIDNDANVAALAEKQFGAAKQIHDFLYVTLGTGIGGAIIVDDALFHGSRGGAGEIGHLIVNMNEQASKEDIEAGREYRTGVLEVYTARTAIIQKAIELAAKYPDSLLNKRTNQLLDVSDVSRAAGLNDVASLECLAEIGTVLGLGIASAFALLDLSTVIIGGGISLSHPILFAKIEDSLRRRSLPAISSNVCVLKARFGEEAGLIGAAVLAMRGT